MRLALVAAALAILIGGTAVAAPPARKLGPELEPLGFLVGGWTAGQGEVEGGGTSTGRSSFSIEAGGGALLRRDHTRLKGPDGKRAGGMDQVMLIYPEGGTLRADYSDGAHVIHYVAAEVTPGRAVTFRSAPQPGAPSFRLTYALTPPDELSVRFEMAAPGETTFKPVADGTLKRKPPRAKVKRAG